METHDKIERLLDMIEHPEQYSEKEMEELLSDKECREYYELMVKTDSAYSNKSEIDVDGALRKFERKHTNAFVWRKIAAIFIGILIISGLAYAAIKLQKHISQSSSKALPRTENVVVKKNSIKSEVQQADTIAMNNKVFDNVELVAILHEISAYYHLKVEYKSDKSKHLRLHLSWDKTQDIEEVVAMLNNFEKVNLTLADDKIVVE